MRIGRILAIGLALAASASAFPAAAQATAPLVLREYEGGAILARGTSLLVFFNEDSPTESFCTYIANAKVAINLRTTDLVAFNFPLECEGGRAWTGTMTGLKVNTAGTVTMTFKPKLAVPTEGGTCNYETARLTGTVSLPGYLGYPQYIYVTELALRNSEKSAPSCPRHEQVTGVAEVLEVNHSIYAELGV